MNDSKSKVPSPSPSDGSPAALTESDSGETVMTYGTPETRLPYVFIVLVWAGFLVGLISYVVLYYLPDLAEWRAW